MDSPLEILSDDDDSFFTTNLDNAEETILLSSDEDQDNSKENLTSDEELPSVELQQKKSAIIRVLFETGKKNNAQKPVSFSKPVIKKEVQPVKELSIPSTSIGFPENPRDPGINRMIEGINVNLPVNPYGCQVALMSMLIKAIKRQQNCLLESPTGSGKTLALLCGALGWLSAEKKVKAELQAQMYFSSHPELSQVDGAKEYVASPMKKNQRTPDKFFSKNTFGDRSIYDKPSPMENSDELIVSSKRQDPLSSFDEDSPEKGQVRIHKKRKLDAMESSSSGEASKLSSPKRFTTPEKSNSQSDPESPQNLRHLIENLHIRTSMLVDCSVPTIYYGARTHKQLQQVIKEFGRTSYSAHMKMTILSSREHSCIREFDKQMWGTKNDMCRGCVRKMVPKDDTHRSRDETNCKFYDNRQVLKHDRLPAAFDLEDLVNAGQELTACPYYAAREMATYADIVFCPYNYLIEPSIRNSMRIDLTDNIVIIDEAHNIEDICRDAATYTVTRENIQSALKELEIVAEYRYAAANQEILTDIDKLVKVMKNWDDWFVNQSQLLTNAPVTNNEAVHMWESDHFIKSLEYHNLGYSQYNEFRDAAEKFCNQLQNDPRTLYGVTQSTGTLVESIATALGYLFKENGKYKDDFKPVLVKILTGDTKGVTSWRTSQFKKVFFYG